MPSLEALKRRYRVARLREAAAILSDFGYPTAGRRVRFLAEEMETGNRAPEIRAEQRSPKPAVTLTLSPLALAMLTRPPGATHPEHPGADDIHPGKVTA